MQFGLHQRNQLIERARVSAVPVHYKLSDLLLHRRGGRHTEIILMRWIGRVENALFDALGGSLFFVALHAEEIFRPNGGFGQLLPL
jgi:hypothetical protein